LRKRRMHARIVENLIESKKSFLRKFGGEIERTRTSTPCGASNLKLVRLASSATTALISIVKTMMQSVK